MTYPDNTDSVAQDALRAFYDRWQRLDQEKQDIATDLKELFAEMKGNGFDPKVARSVFRDMSADQSAKTEFEALCDLYHAALTGARPAHTHEGDGE